MDTRTRQLSPEMARLRTALHRNAGAEEGGVAILMGRDTTFTGVDEDVGDGPDVQIDRVRSIPCHY